MTNQTPQTTMNIKQQQNNQKQTDQNQKTTKQKQNKNKKQKKSKKEQKLQYINITNILDPTKGTICGGGLLLPKMFFGTNLQPCC